MVQLFRGSAKAQITFIPSFIDASKSTPPGLDAKSIIKQSLSTFLIFRYLK